MGVFSKLKKALSAKEGAESKRSKSKRSEPKGTRPERQEFKPLEPKIQERGSFEDYKKALEKYGLLTLIIGKRGSGKCVTGNTEVVDPGTGRLTTVENIVEGNRGQELFTLSHEYRLSKASPIARLDEGISRVFEVQTRSGRSVEVTPEHPFLTIGGWKQCSELSSGERIAVPREVPVFGEMDWENWKIKTLAYLLGDGKITGGKIEFYNNNSQLIEDFAKSAAKFRFTKVKRENPKGRTKKVSVTYDPNLSDDDLRFFRSKYKLHYIPSGGDHYIIAPDTLKTLYWEEGLSARRIGEILKVPPRTVLKYMEKHQIPRRNSGEKTAGKVPAYYRKKYNIDPSLLHIKEVRKKMIVEDNLSAAQVARIFKCSPSAICASLDIALGRGGHPKSGLRRFLDDLGVYGKNSIKKFIPSPVFTLRRKKLALFLNRLYACDGWMTTDEGRVEIGYATSSKRMARQVQHILLRFGILSVLREKRTSAETAYPIIIQNTHFAKKFIDEIDGFRGDEKTEEIRLLCERESNPNIDTIPKQVWSIVEKIRQKRGISWADVGFMSSKKNYAPSRKTLKKIAKALHSPYLLNLAESDVFWDEVASIKDVGEKRVYDLSMNPTSNFLANDIFVHNTALGMKFLSWYGHNTDRKCYGIGYTNADLPQWIGKAESLEDIPNDSVVLIDEAAILFFSREAMKSMNKTLSKLMSVARHKNLTLILVTQSSAMVDLNVLRLADVLLFKEPSLLQARFERKSLQDLFDKVDSIFKEMGEDKVAYFYVYSDEYEGLVQYDLPYFWNESISRAFKEFKAEEK